MVQIKISEKEVTDCFLFLLRKFEPISILCRRARIDFTVVNKYSYIDKKRLNITIPISKTNSKLFRPGYGYVLDTDSEIPACHDRGDIFC
jgi:hypothetical protein